MNYFQLRKCQVDGGPPSNRSSETAKFVYLQKINDNVFKWAGGYLMIAGSAGFVYFEANNKVNISHNNYVWTAQQYN